MAEGFAPADGPVFPPGTQVSQPAPRPQPPSPRVWLIAENNPYQRDAEDGQRFAMYPDPSYSAGGRFCFQVLGMWQRDYLRSFERRNLLHQPQWSAPAAREAAAALAKHIRLRDPVVLLGRKVWDAWAEAVLEGEFGRAWVPFWCPATGVLCLPHPSGLSRAWNEPGAFARTRVAVAQLAPWLEPLLGRAPETRDPTPEEIARRSA